MGETGGQRGSSMQKMRSDKSANPAFGETGESGSEPYSNNVATQIAVLQTEIMNLQQQNKTLRSQLGEKPEVEFWQEGDTKIKTERNTRTEGNTKIIEINEYHYTTKEGKSTGAHGGEK